MNHSAPSGSSYVSIERVGAVAIVRYVNEPDALIGMAGAAELNSAIGGLLEDAAIRAVVLTGARRGAFIRNADVADIVRAARAVRDGRIEPVDFEAGPFMYLCSVLEGSPKPVIAAIDGPCMGGGLEIALACTMRVAGSGASVIGLPEIRLAITPGCGGVPRLAKLVGPHRARLMALTGQLFDARQACDAGIVDKVCDDALSVAVEIADRLAGRNPAAVSLIMRSALPDFTPTDSAREFAVVAAGDDAIARLETFLAHSEKLDELI